MKPSLHYFFSFILVFLTLFQGDLKASTTCSYNTALDECAYIPASPGDAEEDNPCYAPGWHNTYNITEHSATFQWEEVYGASYYTIQWRYQGGTWYTLGGYCYSTWINIYDLDPCNAYEWRVKSHCGYGYSSPWCYPVYFNTHCDVCPKPYGLYATNITDYSAKLHWSEVWGATDYVLQIQWPNGSWMTIPGSPCQDNWLNVYNLEPGTMYEWRVKAKCGYNNYSDWAYGWFTTTHSYYCHYPSWLQCYDISDYGATWKWENVYGADYYHIQWRYPGGTWYNHGGNHYGTWVSVNHLNPCTTYEWRVKSYCHYGGWSNWCYPYTFTTTCHSSCPVPSNLQTIEIGDYKATLKWAPVYDATSYTVQMKDAWGSWYDVPGGTTNGIWITVHNLTHCKSYEWRVRANCHYGSHSYWSKPKHFTTSCGNGCYAPEWVYTNGITPTSATFHWAPVYGADYYVVEWRPSGGTWTEIQGGITNTWVEITGLQSVSTYEWRVKSHCHTGYWSGWSSQTYFSTQGMTCGLPFFRYTSPITDSTATFNWSAVSGALNYTVQIRQLNGLWVDVAGSPTSGTSITANSLVPNAQYEWRMQVNCANGGYSPWLSAIKFSTGISPGCNTPSSLYADNLTLNSATLHWSAIPGAETYSVELRAWPGGAWNPVIGSPVNTNSIHVDGLNPFATYEWRVRANCTGNLHSFWSGSVQFTTTNAPACNPPSGLSSGALTETTATLSWLPVTGAQGYQVQTRLPNGVWIDLPAGVVADTFVLAGGFTANTTYEWRVRTQCDSLHYSNWSAAALFTTAVGAGLVNDNCANAILLTVENTCVSTFASNVDATASDPPPVGGCFSNGNKDVWFKFTMPDVANPAVTIRTSAGSLGNAVMEVYSGTDCNILSIIACEDNNDNGNGSSMPVINLTGTPNAAIWVRVWGYEGSTGTFTICVFNGISFNYTSSPGEADAQAGETVVELEESVPMTVEMEALPDLQLSPNPVSDMLTVMVRQTESVLVTGLRIVDLAGQNVITHQVEPASGSQFKTGVDVSALIPGMYVLQVQTTAGLMAEKISVIR